MSRGHLSPSTRERGASPGRWQGSSATAFRRSLLPTVLYFQGFLPSRDAARGEANGILHALDTATSEILWHFTYPTEEPWAFNNVLVADGAIHVDTYEVVLKLK